MSRFIFGLCYNHKNDFEYNLLDHKYDIQSSPGNYCTVVIQFCWLSLKLKCYSKLKKNLISVRASPS